MSSSIAPRSMQQRKHLSAASLANLACNGWTFRQAQRARRLTLRWNAPRAWGGRSEEHTSELQSLMRISYAVFCLKKKTKRELNTNCTTLQTIHTTRILQPT